MSALIYFSGGIDSATLAVDVSRYPHRYGVSPEGRDLILFSYTSDDPAKKRKNLVPLVNVIHNVATPWANIRHEVVHCPLKQYEVKEWQDGGAQSLDPAITKYKPDIDALPYCAGQIVWAAGVAMNILRTERTQPYGPRQALFGFQFDGPRWKAADAGKLRPLDITPKFVASLNSVAKAAGEPIVYRAPFLENRMDRTQIVRLGLELKVPWEHTTSCVEGWRVQCGYCNQCLRRERTFKYLGIKKG